MSIHFDSVLVDVGAGASYSSTMLQSGGRIARTNHLVELTGEKASSNLRALSPLRLIACSLDSVFLLIRL